MVDTSLKKFQWCYGLKLGLEADDGDMLVTELLWEKSFPLFSTLKQLQRGDRVKIKGYKEDDDNVIDIVEVIE